MSDPAVIMVVDDQELNQRVMSAMLEQLGYRLIQSLNGLDALEQI